MEDFTFAVKHTTLTDQKSDQTPACISPIDFTTTGEVGSDSSSGSGNTSSSSSWGDDLDVEKLIQSVQRQWIRKRKPRKRRSLKEIQEIGSVDEKLKMEKPKVAVVLPPGFLQPLSEIARQSLDGQNINSFRKQSLNSAGDNSSSKTANSSFMKVARKRGRPRKKTDSGDYGSSKTASSSFIKVARKRGRPRKKTAAAIALDTNAASEIDKLDLLEKKLKETKKLGEVLTTMLAEERRKAAEEEHKLRKRLMEASETIEALHKKLMWYRTSSCNTSIF